MVKAIIYGQVDDEERREIEEEVDFLIRVIRRYSKNPADMFNVRQKTKTTRYTRKTKQKPAKAAEETNVEETENTLPYVELGNNPFI